MSFKGNEEIADIINQCTKDIQALDIAESEDINYIPDIVDGVLEKIKQTNKTGCIVAVSYTHLTLPTIYSV